MSHLLKYTPVVEYNEDVQVEGDTNVVERLQVFIRFCLCNNQLTVYHVPGPDFLDILPNAPELKDNNNS